MGSFFYIPKIVMQIIMYYSNYSDISFFLQDLTVCISVKVMSLYLNIHYF